MSQTAFKVKQEIIRKDENQKWEKLKEELIIIYDKFDEGTIVNKISNKTMVRKILRRMDQLEVDEEGGLIK